ncbi:MAG: MATE family efflux transporter [Myxococcota bacterium]
MAALDEPVQPLELLRLAVPSAAFVVLTNAYRLVDQFWIQGVSTAAQAAIGSSIFVLLVFFAGGELIAAGLGPLVARATGAGDPLERRRVIGTAIAGGFWASLLVSGLGALAAPGIVDLLGLSGDTALECTRYLRALALTVTPLFLTPLLDQSYLAMGHARPPLLLHGLSVGLNLALTPLFIFQLELGVVGAALAANLTRAIASAIGFWHLAKMTGLQRSDLRIGQDFSRILRIGAPMAFGTVAYSLVYWAMLKTSISPLGPNVNAALGIGFSALEGFTWPCFHGVSLATASFVGRFLGAGRPDLAKRAIKSAVPIVSALGLAAALAFALAGRALTAIFTDDPAVHEAATTYALALSASQLFVAWESLAEGVLSGAGDTRAVFWGSMPFNVLRVPLAWSLAFPLGLGAAGVWWAINLTTYLKVFAKGMAVRRGRWARIQI